MTTYQSDELGRVTIPGPVDTHGAEWKINQLEAGGATDAACLREILAYKVGTEDAAGLADFARYLDQRLSATPDTGHGNA